jgi:hypothetical protein
MGMLSLWIIGRYGSFSVVAYTSHKPRWGMRRGKAVMAFLGIPEGRERQFSNVFGAKFHLGCYTKSSSLDV